jgi:excisionase family DNA binding protein
MEDIKLLTPEEVAQALRLDDETIRIWLREGKLKGIKVGRVWRISEEELKAFLASTQR